MYFKRIEMHGFKSFAEPVTIEFRDGITCIVGPNGSGKSNISDAIRWVLGEQSPKMLRGGKMEEVIFSGTASRRPRGMAEVTIVIDNETGILPIDFGEVAITRRMYRSGESEYLINGHHCRLRDIRELIMDTGIGVDGYSIIGQGKISDILSNKPEARREIFEEAAGVVMYRTRRAESEKKLESASGNLERVEDIIGELEGRIDTLKEESAKASEYLQLKERYSQLEINLTLKNIESIELKNEYLKDEITEAAVGIEEARERKTAIDSEGAQHREKQQELEKLAAENTEKLMAVVEKLNRMTSGSRLNREKLEGLQRDEDRIRTELDILAEKLAREEENSKAVYANKADVDAAMKKAEEELHLLSEQFAEKAGNAAVAARSVDETKNALFELKKKISDQQAEIRSLEGLKNTLQRRSSQLAEEDASDAGSGKAADEAAAVLEEAQNRLTQELDACVKEREQLRSAFTERSGAEKRLSAELSEEKVELGRLSARKKAMEEMEANYEGYNGAVRFLMHAGIAGMHGVVADLITVPAGYETAVETALGQALQNIVCENDSAAKRGVEALKTSRAGRLTFLPVASMRANPLREKRVEAAEGFTGYGTECVEFDEKYRNVMEYLLGRVVIFDTLDHALRASRQASGLRLVTLAGDVINAAGAITGGAYKNKSADILGRKAEIVSLESRLRQTKAAAEQKARELARLRELLEKTAADVSAASEKIRQTEILLTTKKSEWKAAQAAARGLAEAARKRAREAGSLETEKRSADEMIEAMRTQIRQALAGEAEAEAAIERAIALHESRQEEQRAVSEEITNARIALNTCEGEKNNADSLAERIRLSMEEIRQDTQQRSERLESIAQERAQILVGENATPEQIARMEQQRRDEERFLAEINEEKAAMSRVLNEAAIEKDGLESRLEALQQQKYENDIKLARNETTLDNMKNRLFDEFEISYAQALEMRKPDFASASAAKENREIKLRLKELGDVHVGAIKEYEQVQERFGFLTEQRKDIVSAMDGLRKIIEDMDRTIKAQFRESFDLVAGNFEQVFTELFGGGHAEVRLENEADILNAGIEIIAQPPGKKLQNINLMSGGEKTLTAIALMFAVLRTKPTPFCILDEVEAALDEANIEKFAAYLKKFDGVQFALITHQKATMEHADVLYGVTMPEQGISRVLSLQLGETVEGLE